jgi:hypothetical protein
MSEIMTIKPTLHFIFTNESKFGVRNLFAGIVPTIVCISESATVIFLGFFKNFEPLGLSQDDVWEIRKILIVDWSLQISSVSPDFVYFSV